MKTTHYATIMLVLATAISIPTALAQESPDLRLTNLGSAVIDLDSLEKDRVIRTYAEFTNFDLDDKFFVMEIIQDSTSQVVYSTQIIVGSTASDLVSFNSHVIYVITDEMLEEGLVVPGDYQMQVKTRDGIVAESISFTISN